MNKFKKKEKEAPEIPTSALPDIIFILLFFFMIATKTPEDLLVQATTPRATEAIELDQESSLTYIYIGKPINPSYGTSSSIQFNNEIIKLQELEHLLIKEQEHLKEKGERINIALKIDQKVDYGIVEDVKQVLRDLNLRFVKLSSTKVNSIR